MKFGPEQNHDTLGLAELLALPVRKGARFDSRRNHASPAPASAPSSKPIHAEGLSKASLNYLAVVIENPRKSSSKYPALAGMSAKRAQAIREQMVAAGYLREHHLSTSRAGRGRESIILEPLDKAVIAVAEARRKGEI